MAKYEFRGVDEGTVFPALAVCLAMLAGLLACFGCGAVRHLPGGGTAPASPYEQILAWNVAIAQANDGFADNVIALQTAGELGRDGAKNILTEQAKIAKADQRITEDLRAAALCGARNAGAGATAAQLADASAACAQSYSSELQASVTVILDSLAALNNGLLLGIKNDQKRFAVAAVLATIQNLTHEILGALREYKLIAALPRGDWWCWQWGDREHGEEPTPLGVILYRVGLLRLFAVKCEQD